MEEFKIFTSNLARLFKEELNASDETCREIEEMESLFDVRCFLEESKELKDLLDIDDLSSDVDDLEDEVSDLEDRVESLEEEIYNLQTELKNKVFNPQTFWDEEKYNLFLRYHNKFTPGEFEALMTK